MDCLALGAAPLRHVLVHALGVGDEPGGVSVNLNFLAGSDLGRPRRPLPVDRVRRALGFGCPNQYLSSGVSSRFWLVGLASPLDKKETLVRRSDAGLDYFSSLHRPVVSAQL